MTNKPAQMEFDFESEGYAIASTGGGNSAMVKTLPNVEGASRNNVEIWLTDSDGCSHWVDGDSDHWLIGLHYMDSHDEYGCTSCLTAQTAIEAIEAARVIELANAFAIELEREIGPESFITVSVANSAACASHDFTDANMTMARAWESVFGESPAFLADPDDVASLDRWNRAWAFARENAFFRVSNN